MALLNVRSLANKTFLVSDLISSHKLACIFLTETWLDATGSSRNFLKFRHLTYPFLTVLELIIGGGVAAIFF